MKSYFVVGYASDQGRRDSQEDAYAVHLNLADPAMVQRKGALFLVADGVGGYVAGAEASGIARDVIPQHYFDSSSPDIIEVLRAAILAANRAVYDAARSQGSDKMATTVAVAVVRADELYVGHVGDSRAYLWRARELRQLTEDHSWVGEQVRRGLLSAEGIDTHPYRNVITRALGAKQDVVPEVRPLGRLADGDRLLLCTDGVYKAVAPAQMADMLDRLAPPEACQELADLARDAGGTDNATVIIAEFHGESQPVAEAGAFQAAEGGRLPPAACTLRFQRSARPELFEETQALGLQEGRSVTCGITVRPEFYEGRFPVAVQVWADAGTGRVSHLLIGDEVHLDALGREPSSGLSQLASEGEVVELRAAGVRIRISLPECDFATARRRHVRAAAVCFQVVDVVS